MNSDVAFFREVMQANFSIAAVAMDEWIDSFQLKTYKKNSFLVKSGEFTQSEVFISSGIMRSFYQVNETEKNSAFFSDGSFLTPWHIRTEESRSVGHHQFLSDSTVFLFDQKVFADLRMKYKSLQDVGEQIVALELMRLRNREIQLLGLNAKDRYYAFAQDFPHLINQLAQFHIASYLNISPVSLSRLRAEA